MPLQTAFILDDDDGTSFFITKNSDDALLIENVHAGFSILVKADDIPAFIHAIMYAGMIVNPDSEPPELF